MNMEVWYTDPEEVQGEFMHTIFLRDVEDISIAMEAAQVCFPTWTQIVINRDEDHTSVEASEDKDNSA